jgi:CheY-like chemotaxis protein
VLIVDDDDDGREIYGCILDRAGFSVDQAGSGAGALAHVARTRPDAIVLDYQMPGMNGAETWRQLRRCAATRRVPVVMLSGTELTALPVTWDALLEKPCTAEELIETLWRLLERLPSPRV